MGGRVRIRGRLASGLVEAAVAAVILITVALTAPGRAPAPSRPGPLAGWAAQSIPVITALIDDVTAVERSTAPAGAPAFGRDLARARALPAPPDPAAASVWNTTLNQLQDGWRALEQFGPRPSPAAVASIRAQIGTAGAELIELGQGLPTGP
jgi:hypothetical protein